MSQDQLKPAPSPGNVNASSAVSPLKVLIAGCGIGGLAAALAVADAGAKVRIFEKRQDPSEEGAGIQIGPNGTRILQQLGVADALQDKIAVPETLQVFDGRSGSKLNALPLGNWLAERHQAPYWVLHRIDLHKALRDKAESHPSISLVLGVEITDAKTTGEGIEIFSHGTAVGTGDLLVAADGLRSKLREKHFDAAPLKYTGKSAARTVIARSDVPDGISADDVGIWLAPEGHVVHYPVRQGNELAIIVIRNSNTPDEGWATAIEPQWVAEAVADFASPVRHLIASSSNWRKWALFGTPAFRTWRHGRIVLLGDAAHPILPFFAQGAVLALEDAHVLAGQLKSNSNVEDALEAYSNARLPRATAVQNASRRNGEIYHLSGPMRLARNMTLRLAPPAQLMTRYDWLYGWR